MEREDVDDLKDRPVLSTLLQPRVKGGDIVITSVPLPTPVSNSGLISRTDVSLRKYFIYSSVRPPARQGSSSLALCISHPLCYSRSLLSHACLELHFKRPPSVT